MDKLKSFIKSIFPPKQKILNLFKLAYIVLFIISIPNMFESSGIDAASVFWENLAEVISWIIFIIFLLSLPIYYNSKLRNHIFIPILILQIYLYFIAIRAHRYTAGLLDPIYLTPVLITFILWNNKSKKFSRNLIIFLFIPFFLVAFDKIITLGFQLSCSFTIPKAQYNPIYLPRQFFHIENERLVPNIQEISEIPSFHDLPKLNREYTILVYDSCGWVKEKIANELLKRGNIILCKTRKDAWNWQKYTNTSQQTIIKINGNNKKITIAQLHSNLFIKKYENFWLRDHSISYCGYGNIFQTQHIHFKNEYQTYIKLSNKGE